MLDRRGCRLFLESPELKAAVRLRLQSAPQSCEVTHAHTERACVVPTSRSKILILRLCQIFKRIPSGKTSAAGRNDTAAPTAVGPFSQIPNQVAATPVLEFDAGALRHVAPIAVVDVVALNKKERSLLQLNDDIHPLVER